MYYDMDINAELDVDVIAGGQINTFQQIGSLQKNLKMGLSQYPPAYNG